MTTIQSGMTIDDNTLMIYPGNIIMVNTLVIPTIASIASVAFSGQYSDLSGKPAIPAVQIQSDWSQSNTSSLDFIKNKPLIPSVAAATSAFSLPITATGATGTLVSSTNRSSICVTYSTSVTVTLGGSPISRVILKYCSTNSATETDWVEIGRCSTAQPTTLSVTVGGVYTQEQQIYGDLPQGWFVKAVNTGSTGTHSEAFVVGQKTLYG